MYAIEDIMVTNVVTISSFATVREAAKAMAAHRFGSLIVVPEGLNTMNASELGIITERDILVKIVAADRSHDVPVSDVMSKPLFHVDVASPLIEAADLMTAKNIRRVAVTRDGSVVGILSLRDITRRLRFSSAKGLLCERERDYFRRD